MYLRITTSEKPTDESVTIILKFFFSSVFPFVVFNLLQFWGVMETQLGFMKDSHFSFKQRLYIYKKNPLYSDFLSLNV